MNCLIQLFFVMCILLILFVAIMAWAQYTPPQPVIVIAGIIAIMIFVGYVLNCTGIYRFHISG
jgi:hypothetical protein